MIIEYIITCFVRLGYAMSYVNIIILNNFKSLQYCIINWWDLFLACGVAFKFWVEKYNGVN